MNIAKQIIQLALALFEPDSEGIALTLIEIVRVASQAYQAHVGKPIDPSLIKPESAI